MNGTVKQNVEATCSSSTSMVESSSTTLCAWFFCKLADSFSGKKVLYVSSPPQVIANKSLIYASFMLLRLASGMNNVTSIGG